MEDLPEDRGGEDDDDDEDEREGGGGGGGLHLAPRGQQTNYHQSREEDKELRYRLLEGDSSQSDLDHDDASRQSSSLQGYSSSQSLASFSSLAVETLAAASFSGKGLLSFLEL